MDSTPAGTPSARGAPGRTDGHGLVARLGRRDPGLRAWKRSVRAAVLVPALFAATEYGTHNGQTPLFAVFGGTALLLFADFGGPLRVRARSYAGLWVAGAVFIALGTVCSTHGAAAVLAMAVVGFSVLFAGVFSPQIVAGSTAVLLLFVLPVAVPAPPSAVGDRLLGWALAGAVCIPVALFVWAGRWHDRLRQEMARSARSVADLADACATGAPVDPEAVTRELTALRQQYDATPYRPSGAGPADVALSMLVSRLEWTGARAVAASRVRPTPDQAEAVAGVQRAVSGVLRTVAALLDAEDPAARPGAVDELDTAVSALEEARRVATDRALAEVLAEVGPDDGPAPDSGDTGRDVPVALSDVDPTYPVRMLAFATEMLAEVARTALGATAPSSWGRRTVASARSYARFATGHLTAGSVWFRNSLRGAVGLALAVTVIEVTSVQHGFWVVLGTLSVLRSNALGTGATAVRAVAGTTVGFVVGSLVLMAASGHDVRLWVVLPFAVLLAGVAPSVISFVAGQAGFTILVVLIFNIIDPVGYKVGLVRIEDVMIGAGVSIFVGLLFWPRGARAQLAAAMGQAYSAATAWLVASIDGVGRPAAGADGVVEDPAGAEAMATAYRLDDAYRQYLNERGAKEVPMPVITRLVTGCARIRLTAVTLQGLPVLTAPEGTAPLPEVVAARAEVTATVADLESWFEAFAGSMGRRQSDAALVVPGGEPLPIELDAAWDAVRRAGRRDGVLVVLRLLWVEQRLDDLRALRQDLAGTGASLTG